MQHSCCIVTEQRLLITVIFVMDILCGGTQDSTKSQTQSFISSFFRYPSLSPSLSPSLLVSSLGPLPDSISWSKKLKFCLNSRPCLAKVSGNQDDTKTRTYTTGGFLDHGKTADAAFWSFSPEIKSRDFGLRVERICVCVCV